MYNNSYLGNTPFINNGYVPYSGVANFQRPIMQQSQPQNQFADVPFVLTAYGSLDEIKGQMVAPTKAIMFIDKAKKEFYIKSCDGAGNPSLEIFRFSKVDENAPEQVSTPQFDLNDFVKKDDLKDFITTESSKEFVTKTDIKDLSDKIAELQKKIKINEILKSQDSN